MGCCSFSSEQNMHSSLKRIKRDKIISVATLNYCGILKSPFQFYSGEFHEELKKLSSIFEKLKSKYVTVSNDKPFSWEFSKLDKKIKEKRYSPLYNLSVGIVNHKLISKKTFTTIWHEILQKVEKEQNLQIVPSQRQEALKFDMLVYHTLLYYVYQVQNIDEMEGKDSKLYLKTFEPFFDQAFLDEDKKIKKFMKGLEKTLSDVIFIQEGNEKLRKELTQNEKYHVETSRDMDTMICIRKGRFKNKITPLSQLKIFGEGQFQLLDWNNHSTVAVADNIILISGHLSSSKKLNSEQVLILKKGLLTLKQKHPNYEFICGVDVNSFLGEFNSSIHVYPKEQKDCTSLKMRTSMQTQSNKAEILNKQSKDSIISSFTILSGQISTIDLDVPNQTTFLPKDSHPFDHFLVFAHIGVDRNEKYVRSGQ